MSECVESKAHKVENFAETEINSVLRTQIAVFDILVFVMKFQVTKN